MHEPINSYATSGYLRHSFKYGQLSVSEHVHASHGILYLVTIYSLDLPYYNLFTP
jgi:hypothetical protein